jgi:superfamily II RNA helicase
MTTSRTYRGLSLDRFQNEAIDALQDGASVLVCAPTGTGKTVVADWMVEEVLSQGKEVVFTAPIKALSNQKFRDYCRLLGEERVGLVTGDLVIRRDAPVRVMTTEILRNMLLTGDSVPRLGAVIIDEIHFLDDKERGTTWEELLIYLPHEVQIVGLSATLSNLEEFASWLADVRQRDVVVVEENERAVPLEFVIASREGGLQGPRGMDRFYKDWARRNKRALAKAKEERGRGGRRRGGRHRSSVGAPVRHGDVFRMLWPDLSPYLYFVFSRRDAEQMARGLARRLDEPLVNPDEGRQIQAELDHFATQSGADAAMDSELFAMYRSGVAFHHAGLHVMLKALVEGLYEKRLIKVLYCTGTFALGINMPARTAVFDGLQRFDGEGMINLPAREFMQMAGRAGRRGMDDEGLVVIRCPTEDWPQVREQLRYYLLGNLEPVQSRFGLSFYSVINLLARHEPARIRALVERSFLAFHRSRKAERDAEKADRMAAELESLGYEEGDKAPRDVRRMVRTLRKVRTSAEQGPARTWREFQQRVEFLQRWGYIDEDQDFNAGARALQHVQMSEVLVVEIFLQGIFDELDLDTLYGVCCGLVASLPRGAVVRHTKKDRSLAKRLDAVRMSEIVVQAEELSGQRMDFDGGMIPFGRWWAEGRSLGELLLNVQARTDISGDLVGAFRRARDLVGQLQSLYDHDPERAKALRELAKRVRRDEVEVLD